MSFQFRFIPTRVGNTGVYVALNKSLIGSSPRVWGIRAKITFDLYLHSVHPHACGEYEMRPKVEFTGSGSSPRVWGIRIRRPGIGWAFRFIPTRVGNTSRR